MLSNFPTKVPLLLLATAPVIEEAEGLRLDVKFVEGMRLHAALWGGPVRCVLRRGAGAIPFGARYAPQDLGFDLTILDPGVPLPAGLIVPGTMVFAAADTAEVLGLVPQVRAAGAKIVYSLEYTLATRLEIARLDRSRGLPRRLWSVLWNIRQERRRRRALREADGVQFNGYPAHDRYHGLNRESLLYLDGRMTQDMMAQPVEMAARRAHLASGGALRLIHSGRLEWMKGAQDLLPVMRALRGRGVQATLDIYGAGSLRDSIAAGLPEFNGSVRLHDPVDFERVLVPVSRTSADVFLSCHRQSDPSCTYIEAMGCGLAIAGYDNQMWSRMAGVAGAGKVAPLGDIEALAGRIAEWDRDREDLALACDRGLAFARAHDFPTEFRARMDHLRGLMPVG